MDLYGILTGAGAAIFVVFFFGMCIFVHELGHFLAAKWRGLHIDAFSIGFRKVWGKKINGVEYRIGWLPFGGYVELPQVDGSDDVPKAADGTDLPRAKPLDRIITAVAGPFFNIVFGLLLGCVIWTFGMEMPPDSTKMKSLEVVEVQEASPEYAAGLRSGDRIVKLNGKSFNASWLDFVQAVMLTTGEVTLEVERDGKAETIVYLPSSADNPNAPDNMKFEGMPWPFFTIRIPVEIHPDPESEIAKAGAQPGDRVVMIDETKLSGIEDFYMYVMHHSGQPMTFTAERGDEKVTYGPVTFPVVNTVYQIGVYLVEQTPEMIVESVVEGSPAETAGLKAGDKVLTYGGKAATSENFVELVQASKDAPTLIEAERDGKTLELTVTPAKFSAVDVQLSFNTIDYPNPVEQLMYTVNMSFKSLKGMLTYLGNQLHLTDTQSSVKPRNMSGPVGIITTLFGAASHSFTMGVFFVVVICFALAIFNLLPLPVLDGGHAVLGILEIVFRRPVPRVVVRFLTYLFVGLLIFFMLYVTFYDVWRAYNNLVPDKGGAEAAAAVEAVEAAPDVAGEAQP